MADETVTDRPSYLPFKQQWTVFTTTKHIFDAGVWIEMDNIADLRRKPKGIKALFEDWLKLETLCFLDGIVGWFVAVKKEDTRMQRCIKAAGAQLWHEDPTFFYFYKYTLTQPDPLSFAEFNRRAKEVPA